MEQLVRVEKQNPDGTVQVLLVRQSACSGDCHKCSGCGAATEKLMLTAQNPIGAKPGDLVMLQGASAPVLAGAAVLYILPLALFIAGCLWHPLAGVLGFVLGIAGAVLYDRRLGRKKTEYTIVRHKRG